MMMITTLAVELLNEWGSWRRGQRAGRAGERGTTTPRIPRESPRYGRGGPPLSTAGPAPSDDVTEVTSRRPERGWGREAD